MMSRLSDSRKAWLWFALSSALALGIHTVLGQVALANPSAQILARTMVLCWLGSHFPLFLFEKAKLRALAPLECALLALPWVLWLDAHRQGHLDRPPGLFEPLQSIGVDPTKVLACFGIFLGLSVILLWSARNSAPLGAGPVAILVGCGLLTVLLLPTQRLSRIAADRSYREAAGQLAQREATRPVAVVVFYADYSPELEVFHFRAQSPGLSTDGHPVSRKLRYRVAEILEQDRPLVLGWKAQRTPVVVPDGKTFASVYEILSEVPTEPLTELMERNLGAQPPRPPAPKFEPLLDEAVPEPDRDHPLRAALRIKLWMEQNRSQGEETSLASVDDCLLRNQPVNQETFTLAAQRLLEELGFASQIVSGYAVRADQKSTGSFLLLTEQDRRFWLELDDPGVRGVAVDLYPLDGPNQTEGPQNLEMQRQLGELARARQPKYQPFPGLGMGTLGLLLFLLVFAVGGHLVKLYRQLRARTDTSPRLPILAYRAVLDRLAEVEELRSAGETRHEFSQRLQTRVPNLELLTAAFTRYTFGSPQPPESEEIQRLYRACLRDIAQNYPRRRRWLGHLHPFAWVKVR